MNEKNKKTEQKIPEGTFAVCSWLNVTDEYCTKYKISPIIKNGRDFYDKYCLGYGC